jgi:hypothetical protein
MDKTASDKILSRLVMITRLPSRCAMNTRQQDVMEPNNIKLLLIAAAGPLNIAQERSGYR